MASCQRRCQMLTGTSASSEILSKPTSHRHAQTSTPASTESLKAAANFGSMGPWPYWA